MVRKLATKGSSDHITMVEVFNFEQLSPVAVSAQCSNYMPNDLITLCFHAILATMNTHNRHLNHNSTASELPNARDALQPTQAPTHSGSKRQRDRFGRWVSHAKERHEIGKAADSPVADTQTDMPSFASIRDKAAKVGIPNWQHEDDLMLMQLLAAHSVSAGVEGYAMARQDVKEITTSQKGLTDCDLAVNLIQLGHSPKAAVAAAVAAPLAALNHYIRYSYSLLFVLYCQ